jgi:transcriptional regulator with XRE-family HTH domain
LNETLRRALLRARLSEDDVAARLAVDPKTVRRWTEGRVPYLRHRWELARLLDCDEADLWPQVGVGQARPAEVVAIYPHRDTVPSEVWREFFSSAKREIGILARSGLFLAAQPTILAVLARRAQAGARVRICVRDPEVADENTEPGSSLASRVYNAVARYRQLCDSGNVEIRLSQAALNGSIYRADDDVLVEQYVYGIPAAQAPVLHLRRAADSEMANAYLESYERIWADARSVGRARQ